MKFLISYLWLLVLPFSYGFLAVQKGHLVYNNERVFLSGVNTPWVAYGKDFGSGAYKNSKPKFEQWLTEVAASGGNVVRVWVHVDGQWSPKFDANGFATGADVPSLVAELGDFLNFAEKHNIFVILCLWNLAVKPQQMIHLYTDEAKLNSYLEKVLKPMVAGLKHHKALAAYDIINEPGGSIKPGVKDANPCWDTQILTGSGADWAGSHLSAKDVARFINHHADAIKAADPKVLITVGDGEQTSSTICGNNCREFWSDHCLIAAGGKPKGVIGMHLNIS
jgi:mannan endo-1,4-beta-mannosidase